MEKEMSSFDMNVFLCVLFITILVSQGIINSFYQYNSDEIVYNVTSFHIILFDPISLSDLLQKVKFEKIGHGLNTSDNNEKVSHYHFEPTANGNQDNESMTDIPTLLSISTSATPNSELIDDKNSDKQVVNSDLLLSTMKPTVLPSIYNTTIYTFSNYTSLSISTHDSTLSNNEQEKSKSDKNTISQLDIISTPVPNTIIKPTPKHTPTYQLIIVITTDKEKVTPILKNTFKILSLYQQIFSFKCILFTTSIPLQSYVHQYNIETRRTVERNKYGLPLLKSMLQQVYNDYSYEYIGYLNSDILLNPNVFSILQTVSQGIRNHRIPANVVLASRVGNIHVLRSIHDCSTINSCKKFFASLRKQVKMRTPTSADIFILPSSFPIHTIPPLVVGRRYIDYIMTSIAFVTPNSTLLDFTYPDLNYHQGFDNYRQHLKTKFNGVDDVYNRQFKIIPVRTCRNATLRVCDDRTISSFCHPHF